MPPNILCTLCKGVLNSTDKIFSTSCGHIFHFGCMRSCHRKSPSCPECSYVNPSTHEIFLFFEKSTDENESNNWNSTLKILELHKKIEDYKTNFLHLQQKYSVSQNLLQKLEEKYRISNDGISQRTAIISDLEDRIEELENLNQFLTVDNDCKQNLLTLKSKEITELKNLWLKNRKGSSGNNSRKQSTNLESAFNIPTTEFEKEMPPTQLSMGETKLQKDINLWEWDSGNKATMTPNLNGSVKPYQNVPDNLCLSHDKKDNSATAISKYAMDNENLFCTQDSNSYNDKCLLIKNIPKNNLIYPLKNCILTFVGTKQGYVSENDITDVYIKNGRGKSYFQLPENVTLFVQFKNRDLKHKFLLNRDQILKTSPSLELIEIDEDVDGIKVTEKIDGNTMKPNSRENTNTKVECTNGSLKAYQNEADKLRLSFETKDYSVPSISKSSMDSVICTHSNDNRNSCTGNSLFIKNFPKNELIYPLTNVILTFVASKEGYVSENDITKVYVKDGYRKSYFQLPMKVTLYVEFKNQYLKNKFLLNRAQILQTSPALELIEIEKQTDGIKAADKSCSDGNTLKPNSRENINTKVECTDGSLKTYQNKPDKLCLSHDTKDDFSVTSIPEFSMDSDSVIRTHPKDNIKSCTGNSLLIKNFPKNELIYPLTNVILTFVASKEGYVSENDITKVYVKDGYRKSYFQLPMKVTLYVEFKNQDLKNKFLLNRAQILQTSPALELIEIEKQTDGIKAADTSCSDGNTLEPNSRENINTKLECTDGSSKTYQNKPDKLCLSHDTKDDFSVTSITEFSRDRDSVIRTLPNDSINSCTGNSLLTKNELICPINKELVESNIYKDGIQGTARSYCNGNTKKTSSRENINKKVTRNDVSLKPYQNRPNNLCLSDDPNDDFFVTSITDNPKDNINSSTSNSLLIKNFPKMELTKPLKNVILKFVATKEGTVSGNDISKIYVKNGYKKSFLQLPMKVTLFVQFKNQDLKTKFLLNRAQIQQASPSTDRRSHGSPFNVPERLGSLRTPTKNCQPSNIQNASTTYSCSHDSEYYAVKPLGSPRTPTKDFRPSNSSRAVTTNELIEIDKQNDDIDEDLLKYAKQKLCDKGFSYFFRQNDEVIALKNRSDTEGICIIDKAHVNKLLNSQKKN